MRSALVIGLIVAVMLGGASIAAAQVSVVVDNNQQHQTMHGFGATHMTLVYGGKGDVLSSSQRAEAVDALFKKVGITTGQVPAVFEAPASSTLATFFGAQANDNSDPLKLDWNGVYSGTGDVFKQKVVDIAGGAFDLYPDIKINVRWGSKWLKAIRSADYSGFLQECAEQALAGITYWKKTYGSEPRYAMLFNEPTSGNNELDGGNDQQIVDIVKHAGARLRGGGFNAVQFVVPGQETEAVSLATATAIMNDPEARKYVGAIAYHPYPYGSTYSYVPNILATSGAGKPDSAKVKLRNQLRDLGATYGVPVWMTEVSHAYLQADNVQATDFRILRGRAIHINDELQYANASAFFGMNSIWDTTSQADHFGTDGSEMMTTEQDTIVLVDKTGGGKVVITSTGRAIGHWAHWIKKGARRIAATSNDPLVLVTAFRDDGQGGRLVLVIINNAASARDVVVTVKSLAVSGSLTGEQSSAGAAWKPLGAMSATGPSSFSLSVPAESVTTVASQPSGQGTPDGGGASQGDASGGSRDARRDSNGAPTSGGGGCSCEAASHQALCNHLAALIALVFGAGALVRCRSRFRSRRQRLRIRGRRRRSA